MSRKKTVMKSNSETLLRVSRQLNKTIQIRSHRYGRLQLRRILSKDLMFIEELLASESSEREFCVQVVHHHLVKPQLDIRTVGGWSDRFLLRVAISWIQQVPRISPSEEKPSFATFKSTMSNYVAEQHRLTREVRESIQQSAGLAFESLAKIGSSIPKAYEEVAKTLDIIRLDNQLLSQQLGKLLHSPEKGIIAKQLAVLEADRYRIPGIADALGRINEQVGSSLVEAANQASRSLVNALDLARPKYFEEANLLAQSAREAMQGVGKLVDSSLASQMAASAQIARMAQLSVMSEASLAQVVQRDVPIMIRLNEQVGNAFQSTFEQLSRTYADLYIPAERVVSDVLAKSSLAHTLPSVEYYNSTHLLETFSFGRTHRESQFRQRVTKEVSDETEDALTALLAEFDPDLIRLWRGAKQALYSDNPDRARHFAVSVRELFTHVLHRLSPDDEVYAWNPSRELHTEKGPTRKARLLFIARHIDQGPFHDFVETDVQAVLQFVDLFHRGTHKVEIQFTEAQLRALQIKMESILRFLIEVSRGGK